MKKPTPPSNDRSRDRSRLRGDLAPAPINQLNSPEPGPERMTYRKTEAASVLGISIRKLHDHLKSGEIESFKLNRVVLIPASGLNAFIKDRSKKGAQD